MRKKININKKKDTTKKLEKIKKSNQKKKSFSFQHFYINVLSVNLKCNPMFDLMYMIFLPKK